MTSTSLTGKRILLTHANQFMGPALAEVFGELGAEVLADDDPLLDPAAPAAVVARSGRVAVQGAGVELAPFNIQVNAIAQDFVDNPTYFPAQVQANPKFQERLAREVPLGRLVSAREDAQFCAYLCSDAAACFVGQVFPLSGGWAVR
jgi:NAD(P)-dependent dehydrogenase (short-subunit alcohol dehydrogenase family)